MDGWCRHFVNGALLLSLLRVLTGLVAEAANQALDSLNIAAPPLDCYLYCYLLDRVQVRVGWGQLDLSLWSRRVPGIKPPGGLQPYSWTEDDTRTKSLICSNSLLGFLQVITAASGGKFNKADAQICSLVDKMLLKSHFTLYLFLFSLLFQDIWPHSFQKYFL